MRIELGTNFPNRRPTRWPLVLRASDALVLQDPDDHPTILGLTLRGCVRSYLRARAHCTRSKHIRQWNIALLFQKLEHMIGAFHAQPLVQCGTAHLRGISLHLNDVGSDALGLLRQLQQVRFVLRFDNCAAVGKVDCRLSEDVVISQLAEALVVGRDRCLIRGDRRSVCRSLLPVQPGVVAVAAESPVSRPEFAGRFAGSVAGSPGLVARSELSRPAYLPRP